MSETLQDFIKRYSEDDNVFWAMESGNIQNILDDALDSLATAQARIKELDAELASANNACKMYAERSGKFARQADELQAKVKELECSLEAWHTVFGTTQLSHAQARLEASESKVKKLEAKVKKLENDQFEKRINEVKALVDAM